MSPYTFFPSIDGGFCCDQKAIYVNSHNLAVWVLQYSDNGSKNTLRIAVATTRAKLRSGLASDWDYYDFNPQQVGWPTGHWCRPTPCSASRRSCSAWREVG